MRINMSEVQAQKSRLTLQLGQVREQLASTKQSLVGVRGSTALEGQVKEAIDAKINNHHLPLLSNYENALTMIERSYSRLIREFKSITGETSDTAIINTDYLTDLKTKVGGILTDSQKLNSEASRIYSSISDILPLSSPSLSEMNQAKSEMDKLLAKLIADMATFDGLSQDKGIESLLTAQNQELSSLGQAVGLGYHHSGASTFFAQTDFRRSVKEVGQVLNGSMDISQLQSALAKEILNSPYSGQIAEGDLAHFRNLDKKSQEDYAKFIRSPFEAQINAMTLAELEDKYGHLIQGEKSFRNTGYGRVLTGGLTPEQYNYIIRRYEYLVARGDVGKVELDRLETMFANLRPEDKAKLDAMTLPELVEQDSLLIYGRRGLEFDYLFGSAADRARIDYSKLRFEELMAQEIIDWRDPQYMEKLNAYVNETGLDPRTGKEASDDVKFVAEHYGWVKSSSTTAVSIVDAFMDFSEIIGNTPKSNVSNYTNSEVAKIINRRGYSVEDFLYLTDADSVLSTKQTAIVRDIRLQIGLPDSGTRMAKVIPTKYVEDIISGERTSFGGFVSVDSHSSSLKTMDEVFEGNRLDYPNTPYNLQTDDTYAKINFTLDSKMRLDIPLEEPKVGEYPFTGRGFTGSKEIVLPEYKLRKGADYHYMEGDTISIYDSHTGNAIQKYGYTKQNGWIILEQ